MRQEKLRKNAWNWERRGLLDTGSYTGGVWSLGNGCVGMARDDIRQSLVVSVWVTGAGRSKGQEGSHSLVVCVGKGAHD